MSPREYKGKQKIEVKKIEWDEDRMATFLKRRNEIYNKLSELSVLCGADVGFLELSNAGRAYPFGSPSFQATAEGFLKGGAASSSPSPLADLINRKERIDELCKLLEWEKAELDKLEKEVAAMEEASAAAESVRAGKNLMWWQVDPKEVKDVEEIRRLKRMYKEFQKLIKEELVRRGAASSN